MKIFVLIAARLLLAVAEETDALCSIPTEPKYGSMTLNEAQPIVGSIVVYSCDRGRKLVGSATSKCLPNGKWTYPTPECLERCLIHEVLNGEIGKFEIGTVFKKYEVGTEVRNEEELVLRCDRGYEPLGKAVLQVKISCLYGVWSEKPICKPALCRSAPPQVHDATVMSIQKHHGGNVVYLCNSYLSRVNVTCSFGSWQSPVPVCRDTRCYVSKLNSPGIVVRDEKQAYHDGESFSPTCLNGYVSSSANMALMCKEGDWEDHLPPCIPANCEQPPPALLDGRVKRFDRNHNSSVKYECDTFFTLQDEGKVRCLLGQWTGKMPSCKDTRCYLHDLQFNSSISSESPNATPNGKYLNVKCDPGYKAGTQRPLCSDGKWILHSTSPCTEKGCTIPQVPNGEIGHNLLTFTRFWSMGLFGGFNFHKYPIGYEVEHRIELVLKCKSTYEPFGWPVSEAKIVCRYGTWRENPVCEPALCRLEPPHVVDASVGSIVRHHGGSVFYSCYTSHYLETKGNVTCQFGSWRGPRPVCKDSRCYFSNLKSSGMVQTSKKVYNDGESFSPICSVGYVLSAAEIRLACKKGQWEGHQPSCIPANCEYTPPELLHGKVKHFDSNHNSSAKYECDVFYSLQDDGNLRCLFGRWTGKMPTCKDTRCYLKDLRFNSAVSSYSPNVTLNGGYLNVICDPGYKVRTHSPRCSDGNWIEYFISPCTEKTCRIPMVRNGEIGRIEIGFFSGRTFYEYTIHSEIGHGVAVVLKCGTNYEPFGRPSSEASISCRFGAWSETPVCEPASCRLAPPGVGNSTIRTIQRHHGGSVVYSCNSYFLEIKGNITCRFGSWQGAATVCRDSRCYLSDLNSSGMAQSNNKVHYAGASFTPVCSAGYVLSSAESRLTCNKGQWVGNQPSCVPASCKHPPPELLHGRVKHFDSNHNSLAKYECDTFYVVQDDGNVRCRFGQWTGKMPTCKDTRCYLQDIKFNSSVSSDSSKVTLNGEYLNVKCNPGYRVTPQRPRCSDGKWIEHLLSPCTENPCFVPEVSKGKIGIIQHGFFSGRRLYGYAIGTEVQHGTELVFECNDAYYEPFGKAVTEAKISCQYGVWSETPVCEPASCKQAPPHVENASVGKTEKHHGGSVVYSCNTYFLETKGNVTCLFGTWQGPTPVCRDTRCYLEDLRYNYPVSSESPYLTYSGDYLDVKCYKGYRAGKRKPLCYIGRWIVVPGTFCVKNITCPEFNATEGMVVMYDNDRLVGSRANFHCLHPYQRIGESFVTCLNNGIWSAGKASCSRVSGCSSVKKTPDSKLIVVPQKDFYRIGDMITLSCLPGYRLNSLVVRNVCLENGWSEAEIPNCVKVR